MIERNDAYTYFRYQDTVLEWISSISRDARAGRSMIDDSALGVRATGAWTRVLTLGTYATQRSRTIRVENALGSTAFVRVADVVG